MDNNIKEQKGSKGKMGTILLIASAVVLFILAIVFLRGQFVSDILMDIIVPELEAASGQKIIIQKMHVNLFPLYIEADGLQVVGQNGQRILSVDRVKGYTDLSGLLNKTLILRRLLIQEPFISSNREKAEEIVRNVKAYLEKERKDALKVKFKVIEVVTGDIQFRDDSFKSSVAVKGLAGEIIIGDTQRVRASVKELTFEKNGWPKIDCTMHALVTVGKENIEIKQLEIGSYGSQFKGEGTYAGGKGSIRTELSLIIESIKRLFHLNQRGEGKIYAKGEVKLEREEFSRPAIRAEPLSPVLKLQAEQPRGYSLNDIMLDLKVSGDFYIQTLMEFLKIRERIEGRIDFQGSVRGYLNDITGQGRAKLAKGNLYGVDIDSLACDIFYKNGEMKFDNGFGVLYNGTAQANASIKLPVVDFFALNVKFTNTDSPALFRLIQWDPGIPAGKVDGELSTAGEVFNPEGRFVYRALSPEQRARLTDYKPPVDNVLNRVKDLKGHYSFRNDIITFPDLQINTKLSSINGNGTVDLGSKKISFRCRLSSDHISDITMPYYRAIAGRGAFSGEVTGTFDDPRISGRAVLTQAAIEEYRTDNITTDFAYQKNLLDIRDSLLISPGEEHSIKGKISFPSAKELFDLSQPVYDLRATLRNAEFGQTVRVFYRDFSGSGRMDADVKIGSKGKGISITGKAAVSKAMVYKIPFDGASAVLTYADDELSLKTLRVVKGKSVLTGEGKIFQDKRFSYVASAEKVYIRDFGFDRLPDDVVFSLRSEGKGTFDNPAIQLDARTSGGTFKGKNMGGGMMKAVIQNKAISVNAALFNEKMKLQGSGHLDDTLPWKAQLTIQPGRYDFIVSSVLKEVPEDLQLNLEGRVEMKGDRKNITASANISHLTMALFGQTLSNQSDIAFQVNNSKVSLKSFTVQSGTTSFMLAGGLDIGREYDIVLNGSSALSPLKGLSKRIGYLKGNADFVFSVTGKWDKPEINGGMNVTDASFGLRDYATYISSINGYLYIDGDRIVIERFSGRIGGGNVSLSGLIYLKGFDLKKFYVEAKLQNITPTLSRDFTINFSGGLVYKGTKESQSVTGDIKINRAIYRQMVEWRSWLLAAKTFEKPRVEASVFERAELNVRVSGSENISLDNNIARAPVSIRGDMIVKGTLSNPILFGRLETTEGYAYFKNNEFRIIYASIDFVDPNRIKPVINLTAETLINGYNIRLSLEGQMEQFNLALSSDPHLEEVDILALLTVGQVGKELKGLEGGIGAGEATSFLTGKVQDVFEERFRSLTGLDRFQVEPNVSKTTGTISPKVTVSERLLGERVFVTYSTLWGSQVEEVIKIEYLIDKNISLLGVRDEKGSLGGDIKFRFRFK